MLIRLVLFFREWMFLIVSKVSSYVDVEGFKCFMLQNRVQWFNINENGVFAELEPKCLHDEVVFDTENLQTWKFRETATRLSLLPRLCGNEGPIQ